MIDKIKKYRTYFFLLYLIVLVIFAVNYIPGTYLSGWDNLQTELNPLLAVKRSVFSVWEEYQSFGLLAGMAHGADFVRAVFTAGLSAVMPQSLVRYMFHFAMLFVGAAGMYTLLRSSMKPHRDRAMFAFFGSVFYMFNFGTIQMMAVPFEPFSVLFAFLPWNIWIFFSYVTTRQKAQNKLGLLFLINVLATPLAYVQTLFVVYGIMLAGAGTGILLFRKERLQSLKRIIIAGVVILAANAFWLLPQIYFVMSGSADVVSSAKINQLATEDVVYQNKEFATVDALALFEGYYRNLVDKGQAFLFEPWVAHFDNPLTMFIRFLVIIIVHAGIFRKSRYRPAMFILLLVISSALLIEFPDIGLLGEIFRSSFTKFIIPYSLVASYFFAHGVQYIYYRIHIRHNRKHARQLAFIVGLILIVYAFPVFRGQFFARDMRVDIPKEYHDTIAYFNSVDPNKRIALFPNHSFWGWNFTSWGYNGSGFLWYGIEQPIVSRTFDVWNENGESYFWEMKLAVESEDVARMERVLEKYAIDYIILDSSAQPVSSDVRALQIDRLESMFASSQKIRQFGFGEHLSLFTFNRDDEHEDFMSLVVSPPFIDPPYTYTDNDREFAMYGTYVSDAEPGAETVSVGAMRMSDIESSVDVSEAEPTTEALSEPANVYAPFRHLFSQTRLENPGWTIEESPDAFIVKADIPPAYTAQNFSLITPEDPEPYSLYKDGQEIRIISTPSVSVNDDVLTVTIPKNELADVDPSQAQDYECGRGGTYAVTHGDGFLTTESYNGSTPCLWYSLPFLRQKFGYLMIIENKNLEGRRLMFSVVDSTKEQTYIEDRLTHDKAVYLLNPRYDFGLGYSLTFRNNSYKDIPSKNMLNGIRVYAFPYEYVRTIRLVNSDAMIRAAETHNEYLVAEKEQYYLYKAVVSRSADGSVESDDADYQGNDTVIPRDDMIIQGDDSDISENGPAFLENSPLDQSPADQKNTRIDDQAVLALYQSYHPGWHLYKVSSLNPLSLHLPFLVGDTIATHVRVNNWANGWDISDSCQGSAGDSECRYVAVFWPQYLQYGGFLVLLGTVVGLAYWIRKKE